MPEKKLIKKVLVTGSAGTVGNCVVEKLLEGGYAVRCVDIRQTPIESFGELATEKLEIMKGDLTDKQFAKSVTKDIDAVVHTAAIVDISLGYKQLYPLNVMAVRYLYEGAKENNASVFIHISSGSIYSPEEILVTEKTPIRPKSPYEQTKAESEDLLRILSTDRKLPYAIIRPALIYGPRGRFLANGFSAVPAIFRYLIGKNVPEFVGGPKTNLVHAEDVARAAIFLMENPNTWWNEYNIADKTILSFGEIVTVNFKAYGLNPSYKVKFPPPAFARPFKPILDTDTFFKLINIPLMVAWNRLRKEYDLPSYLNPKLDRESSPYMFHNVIFSTEKISRAGFELKHEDYRKSLPEVMRWYIKHRWIPDYDEIPPASGWSPRIGFMFREKMSGYYRTKGEAGNGKHIPFANNGKEHPIEFEIEAKAKRIERFLLNPVTTINGNLKMEGIPEKTKVEGSLSIPLLTRRKIIYRFKFSDKEGKKFTFTGEKNIKPLSLIKTFTTLPGKILDENGSEVATATLTFNLKKDFAAFIKSFSLI